MTAPDRTSLLKRLAELRAVYPVSTNFNEAKTRLLLIDEVLQALGWPKESFNPEKPAGAVGYTDYLLTIEELPQLVVEAKRTGRTFSSSKQLSRTEYALSYMRTAFGQPLAEVIEQAQRYARELGLPYSALTNGREWIVVQLIAAPGQSVDDLKCFYVSDVLAEDANVELIWTLLSFSAVADGALHEALPSSTHRRQNSRPTHVPRSRI